MPTSERSIMDRYAYRGRRLAEGPPEIHYAGSVSHPLPPSGMEVVGCSECRLTFWRLSGEEVDVCRHCADVQVRRATREASWSFTEALRIAGVEVTVVGTGGGCDALVWTLGDAANLPRIMITGEDANVPTDEDTTAVIGVYFDEDRMYSEPLAWREVRCTPGRIAVAVREAAEIVRDRDRLAIRLEASDFAGWEAKGR